MKVIDKTPYQDGKGTNAVWQRIQASMEYGFSWQAEVKAQQPVIAQLERVLEKGYSLVRNLNLENSKIIEPLVLVGPAGVFVLYITTATGFFEAKGFEWTMVHNNRRTTPSVNPISRVARLARALQVYLNRQGVILPCVVEAVLIAGSPGVHIETIHPDVRVVLSDAVKQWAASLLQARPVLRPEVVHDVVDRLVNPRPKSPPIAAQPAAQPQPEAAAQGPETAGNEAASRARVIFHAAEETKPFDPTALDFEFDEQGSTEAHGKLVEASTSPQPPVVAARPLLKPRHLIVLGLMFMVECVVLGVFLYLILSGFA